MRFHTGVSNTSSSETTQSTAVADDNMWETGLGAIQARYFNNDQNAWRRQRNYMRYHLYFHDTNFQVFKSRLLELNKYLKYFPVPTGRTGVASLQDDKLVEILDSAKPIECRQQLLTANYDPYAKTFGEYSQYLQNLEQ